MAGESVLCVVHDGLKSALGPSASLRTHPAPSRDFSPLNNNRCTTSGRVSPLVLPPDDVGRGWGVGRLGYTTFPIGSFLIRFPVAAKIALHTAGAIGPTDGSPMPPCLSVLGTTYTSTLGISARRNMG